MITEEETLWSVRSALIAAEFGEITNRVAISRIHEAITKFLDQPREEVRETEERN